MRTGWAGLGGVSPIFFLLSPPTNPPEEIRLFSLALASEQHRADNHKFFAFSATQFAEEIQCVQLREP